MHGGIETLEGAWPARLKGKMEKQTKDSAQGWPRSQNKAPEALKHGRMQQNKGRRRTTLFAQPSISHPVGPSNHGVQWRKKKNAIMRPKARTKERKGKGKGNGNGKKKEEKKKEKREEERGKRKEKKEMRKKKQRYTPSLSVLFG